jgi:DNA topoisomerase-1
MNATERYTRPPARYTEASLVKKLEELGIGRPSTYAPTISTIQNRGYVVKEEREGKSRNYRVLSLKNGTISDDTKTEITGAEKNKLFPTDIGAIVNDFLVEHFKGIVDFNFTATVEKEFDEIAQGLKNWTEMLTAFYNPFHQEVENTTLNAERANGGRELGVDPVSGKKMAVRIGRYGPFVQIGETSENEEDEKPRYASLRSGQMIETITLEDALELFKLPFKLEDYEGAEVIVGIGRFGPYVKWGESFVSLPKGEDPLSVNLERAIEIINEKNIADAPVCHFQDLPVTKGKGRFGPFIKWNNLYINVPVRYNFETLEKAEIDELISLKVAKEANRFIQEWTAEKIALENGRWGPFIRFGKLMLKLGKNPATNDKYTPEELAIMPLEMVKQLITDQLPDAFTAKAKKTVKKAPANKKVAVKKKY